MCCLFDAIKEIYQLFTNKIFTRLCKICTFHFNCYKTDLNKSNDKNKREKREINKFVLFIMSLLAEICSQRQKSELNLILNLNILF
jgi:hypothetical protein